MYCHVYEVTGWMARRRSANNSIFFRAGICLIPQLRQAFIKTVHQLEVQEEQYLGIRQLGKGTEPFSDGRIHQFKINTARLYVHLSHFNGNSLIEAELSGLGGQG